MIAKNLRKILAMAVLINMVLIGTLLTTTSESMAGKDFDDSVKMLSQELKLNDEQAQQLRTATEKHANKLDQLIEAQEAENAEPDALIKGVKQSQDAYNKGNVKRFSGNQTAGF